MADPDVTSRLMEAFTNHALQYPRNNCGIQIHDHSAQALEQQLSRRDKVLFGSSPSVEFIDLRSKADGYKPNIVTSPTELDRHLRQSVEQHRPDPKQRYIFITAPHSRAPLRITREMLLQILTYHQVMPSFLDFVFPFGKQHYVRDFYFSGFRSQTYSDQATSDLDVRPLGRSGRHIELCYILKSVEESKEPSQPWSIRSCSVHHKFDLESNQASWIIIKANKVIRNAIDKEIAKDSVSPAQAGQTRHPFLTSLAVHRIICEWAGQSWHWYINHLENSLQEKTRRTLFAPQDITAIADPIGDVSCSMPTVPDPKRQRRFSFRSLHRQVKSSTSWVSAKGGEVTLKATSAQGLQPISPESDYQPIYIELESFDFADLQQIQHFEEKVNGVLHVLKANSKVIQNISHEYSRLIGTRAFEDQQHGLPLSCRSELDRFRHHLDTIDKDLEMQQARVETLLKIAADRKALVQEILHYRSMQSTQDVALRAQETAENVEVMTRHMHRIARKTVYQTVSMRIITVVTMFFLPGTFVSTLMSTPLVTFNQPTNDFSLNNVGFGALKLYLVISLPLLIITILGWLAWYLWEKRDETRNEKGQDGHEFA